MEEYGIHGETGQCVEEMEFVAECCETKERVAFTMADLYGWDDETVYLDTSIYLNPPVEKNWAIVCRSEFSRTLNPKYNIHLRTEDDRVLIEPLKLISAKQYSGYRFMAEFNNHVVRTGSLWREIFERDELPFFEDQFELARMNPRGIQVQRDIFISAKKLWQMSEEYVHYGCNAGNYDVDKFKKVKNVSFSSKPSGGFWASPTRAGRSPSFDWASFCFRDGYEPANSIYQKFFFCLDVGAHIFRVETVSDFNKLPKVEMKGDAFHIENEFVDFEECVRQGIDAIEYAYTAAHRNEEVGDKLDRKMSGWDCDSILIMNPKIILRDSFLSETTKKCLMKG